MNKSALALAGFGFSAGIVLFIVVEPLLNSEPKAVPAPQLAAVVVAKPPTALPNSLPAAQSDPETRAPTTTAAKGLKDSRSAAKAEPANLRCTRVETH
jgi:hypothetical protein